MSDAGVLQRYVDAWSVTCDDTVALLRELEPADWDRPTDLPGWDVRAVAAHLAHLESELAGVEQQPVEVPELDHARSPMSRYTEMGPIARRDVDPAAVVDELERSVATRRAELAADPPTDPKGTPTRTPGGLPWDWQTLLSNRVVDVWMHQQDIRRAVGRPGGLDTPGAAHTVGVFARALGYVVGKKVGAPPATVVAVEVEGLKGVEELRGYAVRVGDDGRAVPCDPTLDATVRLRLGVEEYIVLSGGRRPPESVDLVVEGDEELGRAVLDALAVTF